MRFDQYEYLWPPRPEAAIDATMLHAMEKKGLICQTKKNGTCTVIFVAPDKSIITKNRHNEDHKQWSPSGDVMKSFTDLGGDGWYVFVAELLHNKVAGIRNIHYVHDILVHDGTYLVGAEQEERQDILHDLFTTGNEIETDTHLIVNENLWLPVEYDEGFSALFASLHHPEDEGLVLKDPRARLKLCVRPNSNSLGMVKCRRTHKNYSF